MGGYAEDGSTGSRRGPAACATGVNQDWKRCDSYPSLVWRRGYAECAIREQATPGSLEYEVLCETIGSRSA
jgi:hypothetical protein